MSPLGLLLTVLQQVVVCRAWVILLIINSCHFFFPFSLWFRGGSFTAASSKIIIFKRKQIKWWVQSCAATCFSQHLCKYLDGLLFIYTEKILCNVLRFILFIEPSSWNYNQASQKPNTHKWPPVCIMSYWMSKRCPVFVWTHKRNYTHTHEFLWSTAAISASDKTEPKSGDHQMTPSTLSYLKK